MIEAPEALYLYGQIDHWLKGKKISLVIPQYTPHKFAFYSNDPDSFPELLTGRTLGAALVRAGLLTKGKAEKKSVKAFLATDQTIPGLGNGVLQDILYNARIHPKKKIKELSDSKKEELFKVVKTTLDEIYLRKGRSTATDLSGHRGKYVSFLSKDTAGKPCSRCGEPICKESYPGSSIYFCPECQSV